MQNVSYYVATSVDGFIAEEDGRFDRFLHEGDHVKDYLTAINGAGSVVMGRRTYEVALNMGVLDPYPHLDTYVFSSSLGASPHPHVRVVKEAPGDFVANLRASEGKGILLCGGGNLAGQLLEVGLIDELVIKVNPIVFGSGVTLFGKREHFARLSLRATKVFANGVLVATYDCNPKGT